MKTLREIPTYDYMTRQDKSYSIVPKHMQFKGNQMQLIHDTNSNELYLHNTYYNGCSSQRYNFKDHTTTREFSYNVMLPNYARKKMETISNLLLQSSDYSQLDMHIASYVNVTLNEYVFNINHRHTVNGFAFLNNMHSLEALGKIKETMKIIKRIFRYNDLKDIINCCDGNHIITNKFFKLKQVKT